MKFDVRKTTDHLVVFISTRGFCRCVSTRSFSSSSSLRVALTVTLLWTVCMWYYATENQRNCCHFRCWAVNHSFVWIFLSNPLSPLCLFFFLLLFLGFCFLFLPKGFRKGSRCAIPSNVFPSKFLPEGWLLQITQKYLDNVIVTWLFFYMGSFDFYLATW